MVDRHLASKIRREQGKAVIRALHTSALEDAGAERAAALTRAEAQLDRIARLLPAASEAELGMTEIARLTGVSRPTLYELKGRYSESVRDLRLAVLQALLSYETSFPRVLSAHLGRPDSDIQPILDDFLDRGWVEWDPEERRPVELPEAPAGTIWIAEDEDEFEYPLMVTMSGLNALEEWKLDAEDGGA